MQTALHHVEIDPAILYFGTPVAIISSLNEDGSTNLAPMSSVFWLGDTAVLGLGSRSHTSKNLERTRECVVNLPSDALVDQVNRLALTTGAYPVAQGKQGMGYRHVYDKFERSGFTPMPSSTVNPLRVAECPVNLEGVVTSIHPMNEGDVDREGNTILYEVRVTRVLVHEQLRLPGHRNRIDPDAWRPLIMSFQHFYGLGGRLALSRLATIDEEAYR